MNGEGLNGPNHLYFNSVNSLILHTLDQRRVDPKD